MRYCFTPAAERVLSEAAAWSIGEFSDCLEAPALLLGLLSEPECRAAITLASFGVDASAIRSRWPSLVRLSTRFLAWKGAALDLSPPPGGYPVKLIAPEVAESFARAFRRLRALGLPEELGTHHLLWGLASVDGEVAEWLQGLGLEPTGLEADMCRVHGLSPNSGDPIETEPLPYESDANTAWIAASNPTVAEPLPYESDANTAERVEAEECDLTRSPPTRGDSKPDALCVPGVLGKDPATEPTPPGESIIRGQSVFPSDSPSSRERLHALRVIDAAANRAREGLRVVEDYVRFVLDAPQLTASLKNLRHELTAVLARFPTAERMAARDTLGDVGTQIATPAESRRSDTASVLAANFPRLQESLRSLEEFAKILDPTASAILEQLRYQTYTLHRAIETLRASADRLQHARLYVLIDGRATAEEFVELARTIASAGAHVIQLRDKRLDDRTLLQRARALRQITAEAGVLFIMNDRPDLAVLSRADGVHVGQEEMSVQDARSIMGSEALVGVSTHSIEQARQAVLEGANYLGVGPTFPSETKQFDSFPGVALLKAVAAEIGTPAFAIGGIRLDNLPLVLETGFRRVAVGAAIANAASPRTAVREFLKALG